MPKQICIIIVSFNGAKFIKDCIASVFNSDYDKNKYEIIVVDNNSSDNSVNMIKQSFPEVKIINNTKNYGFGKACNIAFKDCDSEYVILLNQDSKVGKTWLKELVKVLDNNPDVACCGAAEHPYDTLLSNSKILSESKNINDQVWMGGGSVIYRMSALQSIGFFDEFYFMYCEDIDLSWRLKLAGWRIVLNPKAVWHHYGRNRNEANSKRSFYSFKNRVYLLVKFGSFKQIFNSLRLYLNNKKERNAKDVAVPSSAKPHSNSMNKLKLCFSILLLLPKALLARFKLNISKEERVKVDSWIRYTDAQLFK